LSAATSTELRLGYVTGVKPALRFQPFLSPDKDMVIACLSVSQDRRVVRDVTGAPALSRIARLLTHRRSPNLDDASVTFVDCDEE